MSCYAEKSISIYRSTMHTRDTRVRYHVTSIDKALEEDGTTHAVISKKADEDPAYPGRKRMSGLRLPLKMVAAVLSMSRRKKTRRRRERKLRKAVRERERESE